MPASDVERHSGTLRSVDHACCDLRSESAQNTIAFGVRKQKPCRELDLEKRYTPKKKYAIALIVVLDKKKNS